MKVGLIGAGFIGTTLAKVMEKMKEIEIVYLIDNSPAQARALADSLKKVKAVENLEDVLPKIDLVIEAASQDAVKKYAVKILKAGKDIMVLSVGAFGDEKLWRRVQSTAKKYRGRVYIPSGAVVGIDGLKGAAIAQIRCVEIETIKPPKSLEGAPFISRKKIDLTKIKEPTVIYEGSAREAVKYFPKNVNIAACISLAGLGFDKTRVKLIADPNATRNEHNIHVKGRFGEFSCKIENMPSLTNPKTSYLAALSAIATLKKIVHGVWLGT
ncbi:MAG: aspartate dehydrogenase [Thermoplasmata archaeon]|nr:MAG: aspartate dehydrogenase [Thermoplasmata archaeon]